MTDITDHHAELSIDQILALKTAARNLHAEFGDTFGIETIDRFLHFRDEMDATMAWAAARSGRGSTGERGKSGRGGVWITR